MALEMSLLRMIALQPLLPTSDPANARPVREAAPADADLTASLTELTASLQNGKTAASEALPQARTRTRDSCRAAPGTYRQRTAAVGRTIRRRYPGQRRRPAVGQRNHPR